MIQVINMTNGNCMPVQDNKVLEMLLDMIPDDTPIYIHITR